MKISIKKNPFLLPQKQAMLVRQLEEELRLRMRQPAPELQQQLEALFAENEHLQREIAILRDTIKVSGITIALRVTILKIYERHE